MFSCLELEYFNLLQIEIINVTPGALQSEDRAYLMFSLCFFLLYQLIRSNFFSVSV